MGSTCLSCGEGAVVADPDSGALVCTSCGVIQDAGGAEFVHQSTFNDSGGLDLRVSSLVRNSSDSAYRDQKLAVASAGITSTATRLGLSPARAEEALRMAKSATDGQLATPGSAFLPALAAACTLLVARSHHLPLSLAEAAEAAFCSAPALGDLVSRVAAQLSLPPLPCFDYAAALDRAVQLSPSLNAAAAHKTDAILAQARFLFRCASKWSLTTGRFPLPLVAALLALSAEVNGVTSLSLEDIARDISAGLRTSLRRYKELVDALVHVARHLLPWGADVNAKNLLLNAPVLLRLMEMRSQSDPSEEFLESFAPNIAAIVQAYSKVDDDESKYLQITPVSADDFDFDSLEPEEKEFENQGISEKGLSDAYKNVLNRLAQLQKLGKVGKGADRRKRLKGGLELEPCMDAVNSGWKKDMLLEDVVDIDIGYDAPPPSFTAGLELQKERRARIEAAKQRIDAIRKATAAPAAKANNSESEDVVRNEYVSPLQKLTRKNRGGKKMDDIDHILLSDNMADSSGARKKRRRRGSCDGIDWEDCIIELLLLHGVNEAEIEQGQYRRLLELHVFSAMCILIFIGNNGETYFNTAALVSCVQNFPKSRGPIVGILKGFAGLSGAILTQIYAIVHSPDDAALIFMVAIGPTMVVIALMFIVRPVGGHRQVRPSDGTSFTFVYSVCLLLATYLMGVMLLEDLVDLSQSVTVLLTIILIIFLLVPIVIPVLLSFFSDDDETFYALLLPSPRKEEPTAPTSSEEQQEVILSEVEDEKPKDVDLLPASERQKRIAELQTRLFQAAAVGAVRVKRRKGPRRGEDFTLMQALIKADFWLLFFSLLLGSGSGLTVIDNLGQMSQSLGYEETHIFVSMISIWNFLGRIGGGYFSEIIVKDYAYPRAIALTIAQVLMAIGHFNFAMAWPGTMYIGTLLVGVGYGAHWAIVPAAASELFGVKNFGALYNFLTVANPAGSLVFSGVIASGIYDAEAAKQAQQRHSSTLLAMSGRVANIASEAAPSSKCEGAICFFLSSLIMSGLCIIAFGLSLILVYRTKIVYTSLYGKPRT